MGDKDRVTTEQPCNHQLSSQIPSCASASQTLDSTLCLQHSWAVILGKRQTAEVDWKTGSQKRLNLGFPTDCRVTLSKSFPFPDGGFSSA